MERLFRDEVLSLAADHAFARKLVNSGPAVAALFAGGGCRCSRRRTTRPVRPGEPCKGLGGHATPHPHHAPIDKDGRPGWLLKRAGRRPLCC